MCYRIKATWCMIDINTDKDCRGGKRLGDINPPNTGTTLRKDLAGGTLENDITLPKIIVISAFTMVLIIEVDELRQVSCLPKYLLH
mmetsp:Transcript_20602/g.41236  ORF Transcript_20602/g.41236 Transcript_20602/m.41236 type:complete len:86 (-) Transcript_20602:2317-2574(-)